MDSVVFFCLSSEQDGLKWRKTRRSCFSSDSGLNSTFLYFRLFFHVSIKSLSVMKCSEFILSVFFSDWIIIKSTFVLQWKKISLRSRTYCANVLIIAGEISRAPSGRNQVQFLKTAEVLCRSFNFIHFLRYCSCVSECFIKYKKLDFIILRL